MAGGTWTSQNKIQPGPVKILLYRPAGSGGMKAAGTAGGLTVTALYDGVRGNDIWVMVQADPDTEGVYDVSTVVDGTIVDEQSVTEITDLTGNSWVAFSGSGSFEDTAGLPLTGGADPVVSVAIQPVDSVEKIYMTVAVSVNAAE